ncbi:MAG: class I SAM-dependent methyltransferase [Desulfobacteraceae bacterium]|nr:class I SAM-dependent methyltransferase [Desulfobacteraceae bacterium]
MAHTISKFDSRSPEVAENTDIGVYPRYLASKKSIDDRALNPHVWEVLHQKLPQVTKKESPRILEIGAGIGTMLARAVERGLLTGAVTYVATDREEDHLRAAQPYLSAWAAAQGHALSWSGEGQGRLRAANADVSIAFDLVGAEAIAAHWKGPGSFHLLIAHAVLDLIDFPALLPGLLQRLTPDGLALLTCNFDGETIFQPEDKADEEIIHRYHASMEERLAGASHTGLRVQTFLQRPGVEILASGRSDWVIRPHDSGYSEAEKYFLHAIIQTVEQELGNQDRPPAGLRDWACSRRRQVEAGTLSFRARNLDLLARRRPR